MAEPVALAALALDAAIGWPAALYRRIGHPVGLFARIINGCETRWNRSEYGFAKRRALGVLTLFLLLLVAGGLGLAVQQLLLATFGTYWAVEGLGIFRADHESVGWPGHDLALIALFVAWLLLSRLFVAALRIGSTSNTPAPTEKSAI